MRREPDARRFALDIAGALLSAGFLGLVLVLRPDDALMFVLLVAAFAVLTVVPGVSLVRTLELRLPVHNATLSLTRTLTSGDIAAGQEFAEQATYLDLPCRVA